MSFNLTTDDVWDECQKYNNNKKPKIHHKKEIYDNRGKLIFTGYHIESLMFLKKHFKWTARMTKKGRWKQYLIDKKYTIKYLKL